MSNVAKQMPTAIGPLIQFIDKPLYSPPMIPSVLNDDVDFVFVKYSHSQIVKRSILPVDVVNGASNRIVRVIAAVES